MPLTSILFARSQHPLVLFLDDLQWADAHSLELLESIALDDADAALLVIGAYRDNEVDAQHPLTGLLEQLGNRLEGQLFCCLRRWLAP